MEEKDPANDELIQEASEKKKNQIKKKKKNESRARARLSREKEF